MYIAFSQIPNWLQAHVVAYYDLQSNCQFLAKKISSHQPLAGEAKGFRSYAAESLIVLRNNL